MHLRALILVLPGCILGDTSGPPTQAKLAVSWDLRTVAGAAVACPDGATAEVVAQPITADGQTDGAPLGESFDCTDGADTLPVPPDLYDVRVEIAGYAPSLPSGLVDVTEDDAQLAFDVYDDGGFVTVGWTLVGKASGNALSCTDAGATLIDIGLGTPPLPCGPGSGTSEPLVAGAYVTAVTAASPVGTIGTAPSVAAAVQTRNAVTDLGIVTISISGK